MQAITVTVGPLTAASANNIATSQSLAAAGALTLNGSTVTGGVAILGAQRRVAIASNGNDSGLTWTITGRNVSGNTISETLTGGNIATVASALDYSAVTSIVGSAATASTVTAGTSATNPLGSSRWVRLDDWAPGPLNIAVTVSGTISYTVEGSMDDPNDLTTPVSPGLMSWQVGWFIPGWIASSIDFSSSIAGGPKWIRITANSGAGSARMVVMQSSQAAP